MLDAIRRFFSEDNFMPHGMCYLWQPGVLWLHVVSDALITLAYFSIPFTLLYFVVKRRDLQFNWMFVCFAVFIIACGTTHFLEIWVVWHPMYWLSGAIKAVTALASVPTAILLVKLMPQALRLPSPSSLEQANAALQREILDRKRAEEDVRRMNEELESRVAERQSLLRAIIDNSTAVVYVKDLDGRYLLVNRRYEELFNHTPHSIIGKADADVFPKEVADALRRVDEHVRAVGHAVQVEEVAPHKDGMHTYVSTKCPLYDATGRMYAVCGISTDITERMHSERRQRRQMGQLELLNRITRAVEERQDLLSILQVVIRSIEEDMPVDFACACLYESVGGLTVVRVGARRPDPGEEPPLTENLRFPVDQNGLSRCVRGELVYEPDISGTKSPFVQRLERAGLRSLVITPLVVSGNTFGVLVAARRGPNSFGSGDCEFLKQLAEHVALAAHQAQLYTDLQRAYEDLRQSQFTIMQQERLRALGQMASGVAHDINNALSPATIYTELLLEREKGLSDSARQQLETILRAVEDVGETVDRLREFYRPRDPNFAPAPMQVDRLLVQVVNLTRARWLDMPQERGIVINVETCVEPNLPPMSGSESDIRDALTNLVLNAVDAMPEGGTLTLRAYPLFNGNKTPTHLRIDVCDTGIGMDEKTRSKCLEPFFTTKGERGTGLGLAMVYGAVRRHSGDIEIESEPQHGTTMSLIFPIGEDTGQTIDTPIAAGPAKRLRILVVDDDPMLLKSLRETLTIDGHDVVVADGGQAGIDAFVSAHRRGEPFGVVLTDLGMPYVDGRKVAAAVKAVVPKTPVIMVTGWGQRMQRENDLPAHVDGIVSKPPKLSELRRTLAGLSEP
jgi:PAS domain S-box-containing protein